MLHDANLTSSLTIRDIAEMLDVPVQWVRRSLDRTAVKPVGKVGPSYIFSFGDFEAIQQAVEDYKAGGTVK